MGRSMKRPGRGVLWRTPRPGGAALAPGWEGGGERSRPVPVRGFFPGERPVIARPVRCVTVSAGGGRGGGRASDMNFTRDVAPGVHRIEDSFTNWYLVESDDGITVVDAGVPTSWGSLHD